MALLPLALSSLSLVASITIPRWQPDCDYDVLVYGSTPAAIAAGVQVRRMNHTVALVYPQSHIGGLTTSGLGYTDSKNGSYIGGVAREFYERVYKYYNTSDAWREQPRDDFLAKYNYSQPGPPIDVERGVQWLFEPHVAETIFEDWLREADVPTFPCNQLVHVDVQDGEAQTLTTSSNMKFGARFFIDASYDGDLMDALGVTWVSGREDSSEFGESLAGVRLQNKTSVYGGVDPYIVKGDPSSGLLPGLSRVVQDPTGLNQSADPLRLQSYNYRLALTKVPHLKVPFSKPDGYKEEDHELLFRYLETGQLGPFFGDSYMPNLRTDSNADPRSAVSTDLLGGNFDETDYTNYAESDYKQRQCIADRHRLYQQGFLWSLANHPRVPEAIRIDTQQWGLTSDEFVDNDNWPYELYVREGKRMRGLHVMTQHDIESPDFGDEAGVIGLGFYSLDIHQVERVVVDSHIYNEGLVHEVIPGPFGIPYESLISSSHPNFLNPVTMSATHVAYAATRMEPTYMIMGQSAATAAVLALDEGTTVQGVDRKHLRDRLLQDGQILEGVPGPYFG